MNGNIGKPKVEVPTRLIKQSSNWFREKEAIKNEVYCKKVLKNGRLVFP